MHFGFGAGNSLRRSCASRARNAGERALWSDPAQPSVEIVRVECAKCTRERVLGLALATLCGDRAFWIWRGQPSAEIVINRNIGENIIV